MSPRSLPSFSGESSVSPSRESSVTAESFGESPRSLPSFSRETRVSAEFLGRVLHHCRVSRESPRSLPEFLVRVLGLCRVSHESPRSLLSFSCESARSLPSFSRESSVTAEFLVRVLGLFRVSRARPGALPSFCRESAMLSSLLWQSSPRGNSRRCLGTRLAWNPVEGWPESVPSLGCLEISEFVG